MGSVGCWDARTCCARGDLRFWDFRPKILLMRHLEFPAVQQYQAAGVLAFGTGACWVSAALLHDGSLVLLSRKFLGNHGSAPAPSVVPAFLTQGAASDIDGFRNPD